MAPLRVLSVIAAAAILFALALADTTVATKTADYVVQGRVYCDTCRAGFETNVTEYIKGAKVRLECRRYGNNVLERSIDGVTDETGTYKIDLKDSHVEDICEVVLIQSPLANCHEIQNLRDRAPVLLTRNVGISDNLRLANPLGYLKDVPLPVCPDLLKMFNLTAGDDDDDQ
ncbi:pollen-specific protein C13-like [Lolium rigidum]|uniref:pollen-specific protein C13-like n=1 Tax=Lolium rigidum TaxID=89674 RepID=UPI001F5CE9C3|nr:pollen-specific protein C13-like [Lolium rigidum]